MIAFCWLWCASFFYARMFSPYSVVIIKEMSIVVKRWMREDAIWDCLCGIILHQDSCTMTSLWMHLSHKRGKHRFLCSMAFSYIGLQTNTIRRNLCVENTRFRHEWGLKMVNGVFKSTHLVKILSCWNVRVMLIKLTRNNNEHPQFTDKLDPPSQ